LEPLAARAGGYLRYPLPRPSRTADGHGVSANGDQFAGPIGPIYRSPLFERRREKKRAAPVFFPGPPPEGSCCPHLQEVIQPGRRFPGPPNPRPGPSGPREFSGLLFRRFGQLALASAARRRLLVCLRRRGLVPVGRGRGLSVFADFGSRMGGGFLGVGGPGRVRPTNC